MRPYTTVRCETAIHSTWSCNSRWSCIIWQCSESDAKKEESRVETRLSKQVQYWRSVNHALFGLSFMRMFFLKKKTAFLQVSSILHPASWEFALCTVAASLLLAVLSFAPLPGSAHGVICPLVRTPSNVSSSSSSCSQGVFFQILEYLGLVSAVQLDEFYMVLKTCTASDSFHKWGYPQLSSIYKWIVP